MIAFQTSMSPLNIDAATAGSLVLLFSHIRNRALDESIAFSGKISTENENLYVLIYISTTDIDYQADIFETLFFCYGTHKMLNQ